MKKLIEEYDNEFFKLARTTAKEDVLQYIRGCNKNNDFPTPLYVDNYIFKKYKKKVKNPIQLAGLARVILKDEGIIAYRKRKDKTLGYVILKEA